MHIRWLRGSALMGACLALTLLATAACGTSTKPLSAADIAQRANQANLKDAAFAMKISLGAAGATLDFTGNGKFTQSPARSEVTLKGNVLGTEVTTDDITADGFDYTKMSPATKYTKSVAGTGSNVGVSGSTINGLGNIKNPSLVGIETVNGYQTYHLRGNFVDPTPSAGAGSTSAPANEDLWVKTENFYPVKVTLTENTDTAGQPTTANITITFTSWNTGLTITVPAPSDIDSGK